MLRFLIVMLVAGGAMLGFVAWGVTMGWFPEKPSFANITLLFLFFTTVLIYSYLYRANHSSFFTQFYLASMALKLLAYSGYNLVVVLKDKPGAVGNVTFFMAVYFIFTIIEIAFLYKKITGKTGR